MLSRRALRFAQRSGYSDAVKSSPMEKVAREIAARLRENGHIAYFAGGCVRDMVRGLTPKDYDIVTDARPESVQTLFPRTFAVGAHFGVIIVLENGFQFEVATFRSDDAYIDGRHPSAVRFSSPEEDAKRRDFTINGMFYDPVAEEVSISSAVARMSQRNWCVRLAIRRSASPKTGFACCAQCVSPPRSITR